MNKKFLFNLLTTVIVTLVCVCFVSCGSDDDNVLSKDGDEVHSPEDNLPDAARTFVGYWRNSLDNLTTSSDFVFYADGICERYSSDGGTYQGQGYWTFNENTNILATTTANWQWTVTLSNSEAWAGVSLGSSKTQTFYRDDDLFVMACLAYSNWECDTLVMSFGNLIFEPLFECSEYKSLMDLYPSAHIKDRKRKIYLSDTSVTTSTLIATYKVEDSYYWSSGWWSSHETENIDDGTITILNYRRPNATLTLSCSPTHVYKLKKMKSRITRSIAPQNE